MAKRNRKFVESINIVPARARKKGKLWVVFSEVFDDEN